MFATYYETMDFVITADGSKTLYNASIGEHYHSRHGAVQESKHVFLKMGLMHLLEQQEADKTSQGLAILEVGFGTGLNFLVSADYLLLQQAALSYTGIEAYPLDKEIIGKTGYEKVILADLWDAFMCHYQKALQEPVRLFPSISLHIAHQKVVDFHSDRFFDIIYFDAFAAVHQPEMWTKETLTHICQYLRPGGIFVTYAITGELKRIMKALGFQIEKAPGAPGKREMLRAVKL